jgi:hypothetical protein
MNSGWGATLNARVSAATETGDLMTPLTIQKIKQKTGYDFEDFIQVVKTDYHNLMSFNQIGRKYGVSHRLIDKVLRLGNVKVRQRLEAVALSRK